MSAQRQPEGLSYGEIRDWAVILGCFTASDLAREMGVGYETGRRAVGALCMQGMCRATDDMLDGPQGYEPIIEYIPPPPGPTKRPTGPPGPETIAISTPPRGVPVRLATPRARDNLRTPGRAQKQKNREREYQRIRQAELERARRYAKKK